VGATGSRNTGAITAGCLHNVYHEFSCQFQVSHCSVSRLVFQDIEFLPTLSDQKVCIRPEKEFVPPEGSHAREDVSGEGRHTSIQPIHSLLV
jgi:hypothetical protein